MIVEVVVRGEGQNIIRFLARFTHLSSISVRYGSFSACMAL